MVKSSWVEVCVGAQVCPPEKKKVERRITLCNTFFMCMHNKYKMYIQKCRGTALELQGIGMGVISSHTLAFDAFIDV